MKPVANRKVTRLPPVSSAANVITEKTLVLLDELLVQTLTLRDFYKSARCQVLDMSPPDLRSLFDRHYKDQLRLVDVLVDRIRALGGAGSVLASIFIQGSRQSYAMRGQSALGRLLRDLLDAHELVLSAAYTGDTNNPSAAHDFAVGEVVLTNDLHGCSVREQLARFDRQTRFAGTNRTGVDECE